MKTFISAKNRFSVSFFWILILFLTVTLFIPKKESESSIYIFYAIVTPIIASLIWILLDTKYVLKQNQLYYYSGPFRGKIEIDKIRKIKNHSGWIVPVTMKPGLDINGLIVYYNQFDDIYISPKEKKEFLEALLRINPNIEIT